LVRRPAELDAADTLVPALIDRVVAGAKASAPPAKPSTDFAGFRSLERRWP
jgi:hypothetical protein